jgi:hypothetical protein
MKRIREETQMVVSGSAQYYDGEEIDEGFSTFFLVAPPLTEASYILQDFITAWVHFNNDFPRKHNYDECLFQVIKGRALFIQKNFQ